VREAQSPSVATAVIGVTTAIFALLRKKITNFFISRNNSLFYFLFPVPAPIAARLVLGAVEFSSALRAFLQE
jgi:hypothetical protein